MPNTVNRIAASLGDSFQWGRRVVVHFQKEPNMDSDEDEEDINLR
jgi:hypothetical protein